MTTAPHRITALFITLLLATVACRQQRVASTDIQLELTATENLVGETTLLITVYDRDGNAIANPGSLTVRGDMSHAGMIPVLAEADESTNGVFNLPFEWTMAGGWIVEAKLTLPNGDVATETFALEILAKAGDDDMANMDHGNMGGDPGEASAIYMRITNRGPTDRVIVSAQSAAAKQIEFHQTVVEDDIARMEALDALVIPAGETLELRPGGAHIMLSGLARDLNPASKFSLLLKCDTGAVYEMEVSIANMLMSELDDAVEFGDLVFSQRWARPAKAGGIAHGHMPMTADEQAASG